MANPSGKTALITGASVGIGRDLAELFARDGHRLVLVARNQSQLEGVASHLHEHYGVDVLVLPKDLSAPDASQQVFDQVQSAGMAIEYLVNNAGFGTYGPFAQADVATQLSMLQVNIAALTHLTRLFLPGMLQRRSGRIMNVGSVAGFVPGAFMAVYYATKAYVLSFSEALATELRGSGVTVTVLCPGPTATEFQKRAGIARGRLLSNRMSSQRVAQLGYRAMMGGRRVAVTGLSNKILAFLPRLAPRSLVAGMTGKFNRGR
ncbi:MAG: SDR family oxidoreductase [Tepidisphaeraceae bacterium]|jgi:hypothetical protein